MGNRNESHPTLARFSVLAAQFCALFESGAQPPPEEQLRSLHQLLPQLYSAALALPNAHVVFADDAAASTTPLKEPASATAPLVESAHLFDGLAEHLGLRRFYREVFDAYADPSDPEVMGDLIDDVEDIHHDLLKGLVAFRAGNFDEALWSWRLSFRSHWGEHATSALRALFALSAWRDVPWPVGEG